MAGHGGKTRTSGQGRPKGVPNKATARREAEVKASGLTPLDYMLGKLRDPNASEDDKKWASTNAAPYVHPKLSSVQAHIDATLDIRRTLLDME